MVVIASITTEADSVGLSHFDLTMIDFDSVPKDPTEYDVVIVGGGVSGALIANELVGNGQSVLMLEGGDSTSQSREGYQSYVDYYLANAVKTPNSPYPNSPSSPSPEVTSVVKVDETPSLADGYFVQMGPQPFSSNYNRNLGGTTLHWMGTCYRMSPHDFKTKSRYDVGEDWPLDYADLQDCYSKAEYEIGVSANVEDQKYLGIVFEENYVYPMQALPPSYVDQQLRKEIDGSKINYDGADYEIKIVGIPVGRNSIPNPNYCYRGHHGYDPVGATGSPNMGKRCEGNSSCTPICPVQAKYNALKTIRKAQTKGLKIISQSVASRILFDQERNRVSGIYCKEYSDDESSAAYDRIYQGKIYIIAANAIETAKLMLASKARDTSRQLGKNLMDHPYLLTWGSTPEPVGAFRGPGYTSGIPTLSDGYFRKHRAAFRMDIGNWGWNYSTFSPFSTVAGLLEKNIFGQELRSNIYQECSRQVRFGFMVEQLPSSYNRVEIDDKYLDKLGNHRPIIYYHVDDYTVGGFKAAVKLSDHIFSKLHINDKTEYHKTDAGYIKGYSYHGAGHVVGTHRMGYSKYDSVVDSFQRAWDYENLYLAGCGSMPTIGTTNPTLTCAALSIRTARHIIKECNK